MPFEKIASAQLGSLPAAFQIALGPGQVYVLPSGQAVVGTFGSASQIPASQSFVGSNLSGQFIINLGPWTSLQEYDSNLQTWRNVQIGTTPITVSADGANFRLANTTGAAIGAIILAGGTGLTNGFNTVSVTPSAGGSGWNTIVGGAINPTLQIAAAGTGYTQRPMVIAIPPASQGSTPYMLPTAVAAITGGVISAVTVTHVGAGLLANPTWTVINAPGDTTGSGGSIASTAPLVGSGTLTALYSNGNYGTIGLTAVPTFTFSPASTITATATCDFTVTSISVTAAGAAYGNAQPVAIITAGAQVAGSISATLFAGNPIFDKNIVMPRNLSAQATSTAGGAVGTAGQILAATIHDNGRGFQGVPNLFVIPGGSSVAVTTNAQLAAIVGGQNDVSVITSI
ncbi:MAG TPA: hypothetical protein VMU47_10940 [Caldimonas sp.]|nr:hypothetical protein [Caldimonas sp.]